MNLLRINRFVQTWRQVLVLTLAGTLLCILVAFAIDSFSFDDLSFRWGTEPLKNIIIPLILAPPILFFLLSRMRALAIAHQQLEAIASTDGLTDCLTRRAFTTLVDAYLERVEKEQKSRGGALLVIDVDEFKAINDSFGHDSGDEALRVIARSIKSSLREIDLVGRIGGEEFSVFLPGLAPDAAHLLAERIRTSVARAQFHRDGTPVSLSISVGGTAFRGSASFSKLYRDADQQLYKAKRAGRNRVMFQDAGIIAGAAPPSVALH